MIDARKYSFLNNSRKYMKFSLTPPSPRRGEGGDKGQQNVRRKFTDLLTRCLLMGADGGLVPYQTCLTEFEVAKKPLPRHRIIFSLDKVPFNGCLLMGA
jgi:hypothetical protein